MALPHPAVALLAAGLIGGGSLVTTLQQDDGVPQRATQAYITAARNAPCPIDYRILTAIGAVESGHGTHGGSHLDDNGKATGSIVSSAGATGPMQFMPATWAQYATDGDGDGVADVNDIDDAAAAAAKLLCASNVDQNLDDAVGSYNGGANWRSYSESQDYVAQVDERIAALPADDGSAQNVSQVKLPDDKGRICKAQEWLSDQPGCAKAAKARAAYLWAQLGQLLDKKDTPRLHTLWSNLNGSPAPAATNHQVSAPSSSNGIKEDITGLPGSAGLQEDFAQRLARLARDAPGSVTITSGYRTTAEQAAIIESHGGECGYYVACVVNGVCGSNHCKGIAADLHFGDDETQAWVHGNAARYGLWFRMDHEPWHIEPVGT